METSARIITGLRLACAVAAVAGAVLVVWQKHLVASPGPSLALVLVCVTPFVADVIWPRLLRRDWLVTALMLAVAGAATALLAYRPADGEAAVVFFIAAAARLACEVDAKISIPAGVLVVALPAVASGVSGARIPVTAAIGIAFAWVAGSAVRVQARTAADLVALQQAAAEHQIAGERQRLAREFHDLVAHTLSVTMLHMTAVRLSLEDGDAADALESLDQAERAGREAMREMRQTVRLLGSSQAAGPAALPHVRDLAELVAGYTAAGLTVDLRASGDLTAISGDAGLAGYRIVQESLANIAKHAPGAAARVQVTATAAELRLTVTNDIIPVASPATAGSGHGVDGMRQRAALVGGTFSAGPSAGKWRVEAVLPIGDPR